MNYPNPTRIFEQHRGPLRRMVLVIEVRRSRSCAWGPPLGAWSRPGDAEEDDGFPSLPHFDAVRNSSHHKFAIARGWPSRPRRILGPRTEEIARGTAVSPRALFLSVTSHGRPWMRSPPGSAGPEGGRRDRAHVGRIARRAPAARRIRTEPATAYAGSPPGPRPVSGGCFSSRSSTTALRPGPDPTGPFRRDRRSGTGPSRSRGGCAEAAVTHNPSGRGGYFVIYASGRPRGGGLEQRPHDAELNVLGEPALRRPASRSVRNAEPARPRAEDPPGRSEECQ